MTKIQILSSAIVLSILSYGCDNELRISEDYMKTVADQGLTKLVDESTSDNRLLIYSFGSPPLLIKSRCIKGDGLEIAVINRKIKEPIFQWICGEADGDIIVDYSNLKSGIIQMTYCTWDPRAGSYESSETVPLVLSNLKINRNGTYTLEHKIVMEPEPFEYNRIKELINEAVTIVNKNESTCSDFSCPLAHLRNMAAGNPLPVLEAFKGLNCGDSAAFSEILSYYIREVEMIKEIKESK